MHANCTYATFIAPGCPHPVHFFLLIATTTKYVAILYRFTFLYSIDSSGSGQPELLQLWMIMIITNNTQILLESQKRCLCYDCRPLVQSGMVDIVDRRLFLCFFRSNVWRVAYHRGLALFTRAFIRRIVLTRPWISQHYLYYSECWQWQLTASFSSPFADVIILDSTLLTTVALVT